MSKFRPTYFSILFFFIFTILVITLVSISSYNVILDWENLENKFFGIAFPISIMIFLFPLILLKMQKLFTISLIEDGFEVVSILLKLNKRAEGIHRYSDIIKIELKRVMSYTIVSIHIKNNPNFTIFTDYLKNENEFLNVLFNKCSCEKYYQKSKIDKLPYHL